MLVDTSVWVDHFRVGDPALREVLGRGEVQCHALVIGELACGTLRHRPSVLAMLSALPSVPEVAHREAIELLERSRLWGRGLGWIDVHLLASCILAHHRLWTRDHRLAEAANLLGVMFA